MASAAAALLLVVGVGATVLAVRGPERQAGSGLAGPVHAPAAQSGLRAAGPGVPASGEGTRGSASSAEAAPLRSGAPISPPTTAPATGTLPSGSVGQSPRVEQTGSLGLQVARGRLGLVITRLSGLAAASGGFVANSQTDQGASTSGGPATGTVTLHVPEASFEAVLGQAQRLGTVESLSTKATDVTGEYYDLQARITALETSRQQYLTIMSSATSIGDILAVQAQLDTLQSEIEQLQSQSQVLDSQTTDASLSVSVTERAAGPASVSPPTSGVVQAWDDAVGGFVGGFETVLAVAGPLLFALLLVGALAVTGTLGWRAWRRRGL